MQENDGDYGDFDVDDDFTFWEKFWIGVLILVLSPIMLVLFVWFKITGKMIDLFHDIRDWALEDEG